MPHHPLHDAATGTGLVAALCVALALAAGCDGDDGGTDDAGAASPEAACQEAATQCAASADVAAEIGDQCTFNDTARDCILGADSCIEVHACYMGPLPDGAVDTFCRVACERCDLSCDAECAAGDPCVASAAMCDALAACLDGG